MINTKTTAIYCANCLHCKEYTHTSERTQARERRVRCSAAQWKTPAGGQKTYSIHTVLSRRKADCAHYESMGESDVKDFIKSLRETLPVERIVMMPVTPATCHEVMI